MNLGIVFSSIFIPACVALLVNIIHVSTQKVTSKKSKKDNFVVCIPNLYAVIGTVTALVFGVFILLSPIIWPNESRNSMIIFYVVFGMFFWLGIYVVIKTIRFQMVVEEKIITVYPLFSKEYSFTFNDVNTVVRQTKKQYKKQAERIIICTEQGKKIIVENSFVSYFKLVAKIQKCVDSSKLIGFGQSGDGTIRGRFSDCD